MSVQHECMGCGKPWEWKSDKVFDFELPIGKRIWPAVCTECKETLQRRFKSGEISRAQLIMEFSTISGRISKKCAVPGNIALEKLKDFTPRRRGKH